jgi:hypothetical protein
MTFCDSGALWRGAWDVRRRTLTGVGGEFRAAAHLVANFCKIPTHAAMLDVNSFCSFSVLKAVRQIPFTGAGN